MYQQIFKLMILPLALTCFALAQMARAVSPAPDGGYPAGNTAEGTQALQSLTTGIWNTANGYQTLFHDTTGSSNIAIGVQALFGNTTGGSNIAIGPQALLSNTTGSNNSATGFQALANNNGDDNTANGRQALFSNTTGFDNVAIGNFALQSNTDGKNNTANGFAALINNTGSNNIGLGAFAGNSLTTGSNNIDIGNAGAAGQANTIRIGTTGTQTATFIAGINGINEGGMVSAVTINSNGQLGTQPVLVSSRRFKKEIQPMNQTSEAILALKPVTFQYKSDNKGTPQFGLIAEEVAQVNPDLVVRDDKGEIYTVRYDAVNAMLLNEFLKEHHKVQELETGMTALIARVKEQESQIQKVSAQLEASKPAPRTVLNNQ
jgi:hypothetical protein